MWKKDLFEDDGFGDDTIVNEIKINEDFARRFEHNNKREDLQRWEELKKNEAVSESDSDESSDSEDEFRKKDDVEFLDVLHKVKNQDPILKNKETKFFKSASESETEDGNLDINGGKVKEKKKKLYLKDVLAKQLIEKGPEFEENDGGDDVVRNKVKSYYEEQEEDKRAFFDALNEAEKGEDGDELLRVKSKGDGKEKDADEEDLEIARKADEVFGDKEKLDEDTIFLKEYFTNRMWVGGAADQGGGDVSEDEDLEETWRQSDYELAYNFRFEENAGNRVMGHDRIVESSVRKKENKRKEQRERKKARHEKVKFEMKEELKRLKNLKKKEMHEMIRKIHEVAGFGENGDSLLDVSDLEEEFDSEAHDKKMRKIFNDKYYEAEDIDPEFGSESDEDGGDIQKPDFDKEDELLRLPNEVYKSGDSHDPDSKEKFDKEDILLGHVNGGDEVHKSDGGFRAARQKVLKLKAENGINDLAAQEMKKEVSEAVKKAIDTCMDEYHRLEYEDTIGDLKTRFKYRSVKPKRFKLSDREILMADDNVLNQFVPLNKLAPYREDEWKVKPLKALQVKQQIRKISSDVPKAGDKFRGTGEKRKDFANHENTEGPQPEDTNGGTSSQSRQAKRRRPQSSLKLSHGRLLAYGKIPSKPKSRKKSLSSV